MVNMEQVLDEALPDAKLLNDIADLLWQQANGSVELEGKELRIPEGSKIDIAAKAFFLEKFDVGFGSSFRVLLAIGGVDSCEFGILTARYCFATLYYNEEGALITTSFHKEMR